MRLYTEYSRKIGSDETTKKGKDSEACLVDMRRSEWTQCGLGRAWLKTHPECVGSTDRGRPGIKTFRRNRLCWSSPDKALFLEVRSTDVVSFLAARTYPGVVPGAERHRVGFQRLKLQSDALVSA